MKTLTFHVPDNIDEKEVSLLLASQLYDKGKLSLGQAAELGGLDKETFMTKLGEHGVSLFGETIGEIEKDLRE